MKSIIKLVAIFFCMSLCLSACKEHKHGEDTHTHDSPAVEKAEMAMNDVYQCPMDCEKGKTYSEEGDCPHCGMALKIVEPEDGKEEASEEGHDHDEHDGHEH